MNRTGADGRRAVGTSSRRIMPLVHPAPDRKRDVTTPCVRP
jgi:hypothetical protein